MKKLFIASILGLGLGIAGPALAADTTRPVIVPTLTGTLGANGWYRGNVVLAWSVTDPESAVSRKTGCGNVTISADTAGVTYTCSATSAGGSSSSPVTIKRDATLPAVTVTRPAAAASYKMGQAVLAAYTCSDARSGLLSCVGPVAAGAAIDTATMGAKTFTVAGTDNAGNVRNVTVNYTVTDATPPVVTPTVVGTLNAGGWYTSGVTVNWLVTDPDSAVTAQTGCGPTSIIADTVGTIVTCSATSNGGTSKVSVTIKRDTTLPTATITVPANGGTYKAGTPVASNYVCADAGSGVASCVGNVAKGAAIDIATLGARTFTVTATDKVGNVQTATAAYTVVDGTPPVITPTVTGTSGSGGWYASNVDVSWTVTDPESAVTVQTGCTPTTITTDTTVAGTILTCSATSTGGTATRSVTVRRDTVLPTVAAITAPASGAIYSMNQAVVAGYACSDALSGVSGCTGNFANGLPIDTTMPGSKTFKVTAVDLAGNTTSSTVSYTVTGPGSYLVPGTQLFAWNDLGMHCADSDYSVFTLLPPFNTMNAQLVAGGKTVSTGYTLTYESTADPDGSINTSSATKTNFWTWVEKLFGAAPAPNYGLTGNPTASAVPVPLKWAAGFNWFEATGIPIVPIDDALQSKAYPMVKVTAKNAAGTTIASTKTVLPVSSEINCAICHSSTSNNLPAKPLGGWVNILPVGSEKDWRMNILRLHDEKNAGNATNAALMTAKGYGTSLETSAGGGQPIFCDTCHNSNALAVWGLGGIAGISNMTAAMHNRHAAVSVPGAAQTLGAGTTRDACYNCHPGKQTECLRGAMGNPVDAVGKHVMECQSCHGSMTTVGNAARNGWFDMPTCQSCHHDGLRETVAINVDGTFKTWLDARFASTPNTPQPGASLFRFSAGHGKLQCEACHNSTHAEFTNKPSASGNSVNDNLRALSTQGYDAAIRECAVCHATVPKSIKGGPHGMHTIGTTWIGDHRDAAEANRADCLYCHGSTSAGSPLAVVKIAKTFAINDGRSKTFAAESRVTCWSCHNGPNP